LLFVGDAVLTTNPAAGRGVTTSLMQAQQLLSLLDRHGTDFTSCALEFDQWCLANMKPWYEDHVIWDAGLVARWNGADIDFDQPLPSDLICSAAEVDKSLMPVIGAYWTMLAPPSALRTIEPRAREILRSGFRPSFPPGPTRNDLAELLAARTAQV
jgi:hypothetical protein